MNYRNIDSLSLFFSNWISSLFFFQVEFSPPPPRGGFGQNIYPSEKEQRKRKTHVGKPNTLCSINIFFVRFDET